jgi:hypothetical protein
MEHTAEKLIRSQKDEAPKVFISYSHDSPEHLKLVLSVADQLRAEGIDCHIDQYEIRPPEGWPRWMINQIETSDYVLVVCTETYNLRFRGKSPPGSGRGAKWEGAIITQEIYEAEFRAIKFIPIVFSSGDANHIPIVLRGANYYNVSDENEYENLYRYLTNQPSVSKPSLGKLRPMPPLDHTTFDFKSDDVDLKDKQILTKTRRIDAAVPSQSKVGQSIDLLVQVRFPHSRLLGLKDWPTKQKPTSIEQVSETTALVFPVDPMTGEIGSTRLRIQVVAPDFEIKGQEQQIIDLPPDQPSKCIKFLITPRKAGDCRINVEAYNIDHLYLGAIPLEIKIGRSHIPIAPSIASMTLNVVVSQEPQKYDVELATREDFDVPVRGRNNRLKASIIFGSLLLAFIFYAFIFAPDSLPEYKQRLLASACALTAGLFGYFLTGAIGLSVDPSRSKFRWARIQATGGFAAFALVLIWWLSPWAPVSSEKPRTEPINIFRVRITVLDTQENPIDDVVIRSSLGGELKKVSGGWELDVPAANRPATGNLTIYASKQNASFQGQADLTLGEDSNPSIIIRMQKSELPPESTNVQDASTQPPEHSTSPQPSSSPRTSVNPEGTTLYRVRITIIDTQQNLVNDAVIRSSLDGELKKMVMGWELAIPASNKPTNGNLTIYASDQGGVRRGQSSVQLGKDQNPSVSIQLHGDTLARVFGRVIDDENREAISGAQVSVVGYGGEFVLSGTKGEFNLNTHATDGQMIRLRIEKEGYFPKEQLHPAGSVHATIILRRK